MVCRVMMGLGLATVVLCVAPVSADLVQRVTIADYYGNTNGGEFLSTPLDFEFVPASLGAGPEFETFCVEVTENIAFGSTYYAALNTAAVNGGAGGGNPDPLSPLTAYLYGEFITAALTGYVYDVSDGGALRAASADALQHVIWYIEEEEALSWTPGDGSLSDVFYQDAVANAGGDIGDVRILNLYVDAQATQPAQDQLVLTPEPASLALLVLGALGRRTRQRP